MPTRRAVLVSFDSGTYTAVVRLRYSPNASAAAVRTNRGIDSAEMIADREVLIDIGEEEGIPLDWLITAVYTP